VAYSPASSSWRIENPHAKVSGSAHLTPGVGSGNTYESTRMALRGKLLDLANERRGFDYRRLFILLRREGEPSGINRINGLYREKG
jgi:hypothetical protein